MPKDTDLEPLVLIEDEPAPGHRVNEFSLESCALGIADVLSPFQRPSGDMP